MTAVHTFDDLRRSASALLFEGRRHGGVNLSFYVTSFPPGRGPSLHLHPYPEVFIVDEGEARFVVGEEDMDVSGGHVLVVPPETPHRFPNRGDGILHVISIHPSGEVRQTDVA